jgi:hypothetical protein
MKQDSCYIQTDRKRKYNNEVSDTTITHITYISGKKDFQEGLAYLIKRLVDQEWL